MHRVSRPVAFARDIAVLSACGVVLGAAWWLLVPPIPGTYVGSGFFPLQTQPGGFASADAHFVLWSLLAGGVIGLVMRRRWSERPGLGAVAMVLGCLGAAAVAGLVGGVLGPSATPDVLPGSRALFPLRLTAPPVLLVPAIAALGTWFLADVVAAWRDAAQTSPVAAGDGGDGGPGEGDQRVGGERDVQSTTPGRDADRGVVEG
jgi:hypothetical protein